MTLSSMGKLSNEALILKILEHLPPPGGISVKYQNLSGLLPSDSSSQTVCWDSLPRSCDPAFFLDNPANNARRKGRLDQQIQHMVLGRPGEAAVGALFVPASGKSRGMVKRWQVESFVAALRHLLNDTGRAQHVVDFGCGTGTLLLPLAVLFPHCHFTGVDMKPAAVALLLERARAAGLTNVTARRCMIEEFVDQPFDVCLALHACGNATDAAMLLAVRYRAAYIVSPCCVGKLKFSMAGGSSFSPSWHAYTPSLPGDRPVGRAATSMGLGALAPIDPGAAVASPVAAPPQEGAAAPAGHAAAAMSPATIVSAVTLGGLEGSSEAADTTPGAARVVLGEARHPRSAWLREHLPDPETSFRIMAKVADQNHNQGEGSMEVKAGASFAVAAARACKAHVELDRNLAASEESYHVGMFKCFQWQQMAKNDLLIGVPKERKEWSSLASRMAEC